MPFQPLLDSVLIDSGTDLPLENLDRFTNCLFQAPSAERFIGSVFTFLDQRSGALLFSNSTFLFAIDFGLTFFPETAFRRRL